jgi:hypothetical protein
MLLKFLINKGIRLLIYKKISYFRDVMRFTNIQKFKVEDLLLDQGNYRFKEAADQKTCIQKIFNSNPSYFKSLMGSVAADDLGELLLVFQDKKKFIVLDGNRRLAALKVLHDPKKYAPSDSIKEHALKLVKDNKINFSGIQAQVSADKNLIFKTVYERHAAGQGMSRINWSAYGAARFRYDQQVEEGNEWYSIALLLETESKNPELTEFIDSTDYSHEVFRRIFKSALDKGIVSRSIFSDRNQRIKTTADKKVLKDAVEKTTRFLAAMQNKDLSLSRSGKYADKKSVDAYIDTFAPSPDNVRANQHTNNDNNGSGSTGSAQPGQDSQPNSAGSNSSSAQSNDDSGSGSSSNGSNSNNDGNPSPSGQPSDKSGNGINQSPALLKKLTALGSPKLIGLYKSLCTVSLVQHPQLVYAGAWSFFESLSALLGKTDTTSFESYINSKANSMGYPRAKKKEFEKTLKDISDTGNLNKHSGIYHSNSALQLRTDFTTLEPLIIALIDSHLAKPKEA